jgi:plastocyanin
MPKTLHWFKWEAAFTWITGVLLMAVVYYAGGGALLFDGSNASSNVPQAIVFSLLLLPASWLIYDGLWSSFLGKKTEIATAISFVLMIAMVYGLSKFFGGRAAYMHVGAVFGTLMVANVWMRILPAQQKMIDATKEGKQPDFSLSATAKLRSVHNSYLTLPVLFLMLSNHYPMTYGSEKNVLILLLLFVLGASVRHYKITKEKVGFLPFVLIMVSLAGLAYLTMERSHSESSVSEIKMESKAPVSASLDLSQAGTISSVIKFIGVVPPPKKITATPECVAANGKPLLTEGLISRDGKLQNVFVWISEGMEGKNFPISSEEVVVDQRECAYRPHVVGVQVGQPITFLNSDSFVHNVHSMAKENEKFNLSLSNKNQKITRRLMKPEIMLRSKCDIHPWMSGFIGVVSHPYFGVSNKKGEVVLYQVPPGTYTISAWHETLGVKTQKVELGQKGNQKIEFVFP